MLKIFFKYFIKNKIKLTVFNQLITFKLFKKLLKKSNQPEAYLYAYSAKTIQKTLDFMLKKQGAIDAMWLQRGLISENKKFQDKTKTADGSSTILKKTFGKNFLSDNDLEFIKKIDPQKAAIITQTHQQLEDFYKKAICNKNLIYHPEELSKIGRILNQGLNIKNNYSFHRGQIQNSLKLHFQRIGDGFKKNNRTNIFIFDEKIDLLIKGEEFIFNFRTAKTIQRKIGGQFYILNPFAKKYQPPKISKVLNTGVYDLPHLGHASKIKNLKQTFAKNGKLIIALTSNKNVKDLKNKQAVFLAKDRKIMLESLNYADKIIMEPSQSKIFKKFYKFNNLSLYSKLINRFK